MRVLLSSSLALPLVLTGCPEIEPIDVAEGEGEGELPAEGEGEGGGDPEVCPEVADATLGVSIVLHVGRARHTASLLPDGTVLLAGGEDNDLVSTQSVEIVDPSSFSSTVGPNLNHDRYDHAAAVLQDGSVVVAGGFSTSAGARLSSIERFDGVRWTVIGDLDVPRSNLSAFTLPDGRAIFFGGLSDDAIPQTVVAVSVDGTVAVLPGVDVGAGRHLSASAQLTDGSILVAGGYDAPEPVDTAVRISADGASVVPVRALPGARRQAMAAGLPDGRAVVFGGLGLADIQIYDGENDTWTSPGSLSIARASAPVVVLGCGVIACGGLVGPADATESSDRCEGIHVDTGEVFPMATVMAAPMFSFTITALDDRSALIAGGSAGDERLSTSAVLTLASSR